jgi:peptide/nickel transport system substrate-binding protein
VFAACTREAPAPAAPSAPVKRVVLGITSEPDSLCPHVADSAVGQELSAFVLRDLVMNDPQWRTVPDLAAALPLVNGAVATWTLKPDAKWSDGTRVSAADLDVTRALQTDPAFGVVGGRDVADQIASIAGAPRSPDGGAAVVVTWKQPVAFAADVRTHRPLPAHDARIKDVLAKKIPLKDSAFCRNPLADGPFTLREWRAGQDLTFARNDAYAPKARLDQVLVKIVPSSTALMTSLLAGEIDATFPNAGLSPVEAKRFVDEHPDRFALARAPGQVWTHIDVNLDDPWLKDVRVRQAIAHAIPRKRIFDAISGGLYDVSETYLPPLHWGHAQVDPIEFDVEKARALLDASGWKLAKGAVVRTNAKRERLALTLSAASGLKESEELLLLVKQALADVGIEVTLDLTPFKVFMGELAKKRKLPHLAFYAWVFDASTFGGSMWRSDRIPSEANGYKGQNYPGYMNDEVTRLLVETDASVDAAERAAKLARVQQILRADLPAIPMYFRPAVVVVRKGVTGIAPTGTLTPLAWNAQEWDVSP